MTDLSSTAVEGRIVECNDEFFAEAINLLNPDPPVWKEDAYTEQGKWMDGWETRRRRSEGHDWCVIALGIPGRVEQVTIETSFFTGNFPEEFSLEACGVGKDERLNEASWTELIPRTLLQGDAAAIFDIHDVERVTHLRLNIFPDGGIARLRVVGEPIPDHAEVCAGADLVNLASLRLGTESIDASDAHYSPPSNMLRPGEPRGMWDGWETKRRRGPGNDWVSFRLGLAGSIDEMVVDTRYFKGNSPGWVSLDVSPDGQDWSRAISRVAIEADFVNVIPVDKPVVAEYVKLDIYPDGGVARLRISGNPTMESAAAKRVLYLNSLRGEEATRFFNTACGSSLWVAEMLQRRPYESPGQVLESADIAFAAMESDDWLEAFAAHPRIGESGDSVANSEQSGVAGAVPSVRQSLAAINSEYEAEFGFTYIVYASGKTATEMLEYAQRRMGNTRDQEIDIGAGEQRKITSTRLKRMLCLEAAR
jgi:allantoicase